MEFSDSFHSIKKFDMSLEKDCYNYVLFKQKFFFYEAQKGCSSFVLLYKIIYYAILLVWSVT